MVITRQRAMLVLAVLTVAAAALYVWCTHVAHVALPFHDRFAQREAEEWQAYGGTWSFNDGGVINRSDERGAKLLAGDERWRDYQIHADVQMLGWGDIGLLARVSHAGNGINAYRGYYAGIQSRDGALILGAANDDWVAVKPTAIQGGIQSGIWYHLDVIAAGCTVAAHLRNPQNGAEAWSALTERTCWETGGIGLRSLDTGAAWKNISVEKAAASDLVNFVSHVKTIEAPTFSSREQDIARMMLSYYGSYAQLERSILQRESHALNTDEEGAPPLESIQSLKIMQEGQVIRVRGVVTLDEPLHIMDATGGVPIHLLKPMPLNVGDEIEVWGTVTRQGHIAFQAQQVRLLWDRTPMQPAAVTSTQAASGEYEGSLIEVRGRLLGSRIAEAGKYVLRVQDSAQVFSVIVPEGLNADLPSEWKTGSLMKIRGIGSTVPSDQLGESSFLLRSRSSADVEVLSGPPWDSGPRLYLLIACGTLLVVLLIGLYVQADRWRVRAVTEERERLAMEMHDTLAQSFAGVSFHLQSMRKGLQAQASLPDKLPDKLMEKLDVACAMTADTHREASDRIVSLNPANEMEDLLVQLRRSAISMLNGSHLPIRAQTIGERRKFSVVVRHELTAIAREAIANVLRHSNASELRLSLNFEDRYATLVIRDNGDGFDAKRTEGFGIQGMRQRAVNIGGRVDIESAPMRGTAVSIQTPYGRTLSVFDWLLFVRGKLRSRISPPAGPAPGEEPR